MRIVFLGSPQEVIAPLDVLLKHAGSWQVVGVVSQPARPVGRSGKRQDPPLAQFAREQNLPLLQPENARDPEFLAAFRAWEPDVAITAAYGQILSRDFLNIPKRATINIHPSLLPQYRGATPVPAALLDGCVETGVTILFTVAKLDAGNMIAQQQTSIHPEETSGELTARMFSLGGAMLPDALQRLQDPTFVGVAQDESQVSLCRKLQKNDGLIQWEQSSAQIHNRYRALSPWPGSFTFHGDKRLTMIELQRCQPTSAPASTALLSPGAVVYDKNAKALRVGTGDGILSVTKLQAAGGKVVDAAAFWNGLRDRAQVQFSSRGPAL